MRVRRRRIQHAGPPGASKLDEARAIEKFLRFYGGDLWELYVTESTRTARTMWLFGTAVLGVVVLVLLLCR